MILGIGSGVVNASLGRLALESVPRERAGMGSGANNTARYLGGAAGVALVVALATGQRRGPGASALLAGWNTAVDRVRRAVRARGADRGRVPPRQALTAAAWRPAALRSSARGRTGHLMGTLAPCRDANVIQSEPPTPR